MGARKHTRAMPDYGSALQFGLSVTPETAHLEAISELVQLADIIGLDLVAIQDHAYNHTFLETWTLIAFLAAKTRQFTSCRMWPICHSALRRCWRRLWPHSID